MRILGMSEIPRRVTLQPDGTYVWSAVTDMEQEQRDYKTGGQVWIVIALIIFLAGIIISIYSGSWIPFLCVTAFAIVILLITFGVVHGLENQPGEHRRTYRMMGTYISTGSGKRTAIFEFKNTKEMIKGKNYIELRSRVGAFRAYIPEEDFDFVRSFIQTRIPVDSKIMDM